ncbi:SMEK domain-containing protein [Paraburkholderia sp. A2RI-6]|uniref:SMEK domain-containing protein n=1 Tax=Paraburkholderia sp. A2RI-6 TaxID=3028371 RepID=UPI003B793522
MQNANDAKMNAPAIDLFDTGDQLCFQFSATSSRTKVEDTIDTSIANDLRKKYDRLMFLMLAEKTSHSKPFDTRGHFSFDAKTDIIDIDDLLDAI